MEHSGHGLTPVTQILSKAGSFFEFLDNPSPVLLKGFTKRPKSHPTRRYYITVFDNLETLHEKMKSGFSNTVI